METNTNHHHSHSPSKPEEMQISASSSPAHEFSFNISLQSSSTPTHNNSNHQHSSSSSAIDLTPADEIFFHGHLLPLHLLHNIPSISPRASTHSADGSELLPTRETHSKIDGCSYTIGHSFNSYEYTTRATTSDEFPTKVRTKAKSFSLFGLARRRKEEEEDKGNKKKARFDMGHFVKRYMKIFSKGRADEEIQFRKQPYSFSGKMSSREGRRDLRGEFSAPASMRTSPSDSGILSAKSSNSPPSNDSSMEELQAAIQAAIAHCKDSIVAPEKLKG